MNEILTFCCNTKKPLQPCTKDEECCSEQLCVWGQCSQNATKGEPGTTCQHQNDCSPDLCCAFHKGTIQHINTVCCLVNISVNASEFSLCVQPCSSLSAWPSLLSVSAALVPLIT